VEVNMVLASSMIEVIIAVRKPYAPKASSMTFSIIKPNRILKRIGDGIPPCITAVFISKLSDISSLILTFVVESL
jgi:hypothetical protein